MRHPLSKFNEQNYEKRGGGAAPDTGETSVYSSFDRHQLPPGSEPGAGSSVASMPAAGPTGLAIGRYGGSCFGT